MEFTVTLLQKNELGGTRPKEIRSRPKWEEQGIFVTKYMRHPNCPFCGLKDAGKEAPIRPDENHMLNCTGRTLTHKPFTELNGVRSERRGLTKGECSPINIRYPVRLIRRIQVPVIAEDGSPTGEIREQFLCSYRWKSTSVWDWIWNGEKWVEWFKCIKERKPFMPNEIPDNDYSKHWLEAFLKKV